MIAYTSGYRFDFTTYSIQKRGVLSIDVEPDTAYVYINDIKINKELPIRLTNRAPGIYKVRIEYPGFLSWEQNIEIKSNQTSYIRDITLLRKPVIQKIPGNAHTQIYGHSDATQIALRQLDDEVETISTLHTTTNLLTPVYRDVIDKNRNIYHSLFYPYISFFDTSANQLQLISLDNPSNPTIFDLSEKPLALQWTYQKFLPAFIQVSDTLYQLSFISGDMQEQFVLPSTTTPWYIDTTKQLWYIEDAALKRSDSDQIYPLDIDISNILHFQNNILLTKTTDNTFAIIRIDDDTLHVDEIAASSYTYNPYSQQWILWSPWEIYTLDPNGSISFLTRSSDDIQNISLLDDTGLMLLYTKNGLFAFNPTFYVWTPLDMPDSVDVFPSPETRKLFFITTSGELYTTLY